MNDLSHLNDLPTIAEQYPNGTPHQQMVSLREENAGLLQIIGEQAEALGHMQADRDMLRSVICAMAAVTTWEDAQAAIKRVFGE